MQQKFFGILPALTESHIAVGKPRAALGNDSQIGRHIQDAAFLRYTRSVDDIKLCHQKRWSYLVLYNLHSRAVADDFITGLNGVNSSNIQAY